MSRDLAQKPNFEHRKKQAKELLRSRGQGKLADVQYILANEYGFSTWAKLKSHVEALGFHPEEALKVAVCASGAARVRDLLAGHPEPRANIDKPQLNCAFGPHALFAAVQRSGHATIGVLWQEGAHIWKRTEWWAAGFGVLDVLEMLP